MTNKYFVCDEDQAALLEHINQFFLTDEEHVNFYFMMHQRNKLKSPDFMAGYENRLLQMKYEKIIHDNNFFDEFNHNKSFIEIKSHDAECITESDFKKWITCAEQPPILIKGLVKDSKAVQKWDHKFIRENYPNVEIIAVNYSGGESYKKMTLAEIVDSQLNEESSEHFYINNSAEVFKDYPDLLEDIGSEKVLDLFKNHSVNSFSQLFVGNLKTWGTNWHQGNDISCALMLNGRKRWYFIDPRLGYILRPILDGANGMRTLSEARYSLDYQRIHNPLYAIAPKYYCDIEPGDGLIFTKYWPHAVMNLTPLQIMANMRMTEVDIVNMKKGRETPTLMPMYNNIIDSDPEFIKFKFEVFKNLGKKNKSVSDTSYFSAFATAESVVKNEESQEA